MRAAAAFVIGATLFATVALATRGVETAPGSSSSLIDEIGRAFAVVESSAEHFDAGPELELVETILEERGR